ncbi:MAG: COX15/CtaA family protein [Burkholderiaceae bacterium]
MTLDALLLLALKGVLVAALPLAYVRYSRDPDKFRKLAWVTAFLTLDLIMFGSFTRLTDSGLGCPDWPGCYGHSNPLSAAEPIRAAETALPGGPVTATKAWIEMVHRYFAMGVGLLIIILAVQAWARWRREGGRSPWLATAALVWVIGQGAFGALTVTMKLQPAIVTMHLLGGVGLLALLTWVALREGDRVEVRAPRSGRPMAGVALCVLLLQIALGGWVSTNYAVMACPDFPLCQGEFVPPMDFAHAFTLWRPLGMTGGGEAIPFQSLVAIHWMHRLVAVAVIVVLGLLVWRLWAAPGLKGPARALLGLLLLQLATGMSNVVLQWPLVAAVAHSGGAALMVAVLVVVNYRLACRGR